MKKFLSIMCCLALVLSFMAMPAFAMDAISTNTVEAFEGISTRATTQGLWYRENLYFETESVPVYPEEGSALNVWTNVILGPINITVYKTNSLGGYTQVYSKDFAAGERDVNVVSNCNGGKYLVKFSAPAGGAFMNALIYQH